MKTFKRRFSIVFILTLLISSIGFARDYNYEDLTAPTLPAGFVYLKKEHTQYSLFFEIRKNALAFMNEALSKLSDGDKKVATTATNKLLYARLAIASSHLASAQCGKNLLYVAGEIEDVIFICPELLEKIKSGKESIDVYSQYFVHESRHLLVTGADVEDECEPTKFELTIMSNTSKGIQSARSYNAYSTKCPGQLESFATSIKILNNTQRQVSRMETSSKNSKSSR